MAQASQANEALQHCTMMFRRHKYSFRVGPVLNAIRFISLYQFAFHSIPAAADTLNPGGDPERGSMVRLHSGIEIGFHRCPGVALRENAFAIRLRHAAAHPALLRRFVLPCCAWIGAASRTCRRSAEPRPAILDSGRKCSGCGDTGKFDAPTRHYRLARGFDNIIEYSIFRAFISFR